MKNLARIALALLLLAGAALTASATQIGTPGTRTDIYEKFCDACGQPQNQNIRDFIASTIFPQSSSGLTLGRVPFATTGGALTDSSTFTFASGVLTVPNVTTTGVSWATLSALAPSAGTLGYATDVGSSGSLLLYNGTRWKPSSGTAVLKGLGNPVSGIANTETIVLQALMPANMLQINDTIRIFNTISKSGTTDSLTFKVRIGTAGTTADTQIFSTSALSAANQSGAGILDLKLLTATSIQRVGIPTGTSSYGSQASNTAVATPVTISSAAANALYVTVTLASSSTNDTVGIESGQVQWVAP